MEELAVVLAFFVFALLFAAVVSLINPVWVKQKGRLKGFIIYLTSALVLTFVVGAIAPQGGDNPSPADAEVSAEGGLNAKSILDSYPKNVNGVLTQIMPNPVRSKFPDPLESIVAPGVISPRNAVCQFLSAWQNKSWGSMAGYTQLSWLSQQEDPARSLSGMFGNLELLGAKVLSVADVRNMFGNMKDVEVVVHYTCPPIVKKEKYKIRVINEDVWGVSPISASNLPGSKGILMEAHDVQKALRSAH